MNTKKNMAPLLITALLLTSLVGCGTTKTTGFDAKHTITVVSREDGSGTRGAFIELMEIQEKASDGSKVDKTTKEAIIANKTDVMLSNISGDEYAIGYVSLGSLSSSVTALSVDGVIASSENIKNHTYKIARPFNIATKDDISEVTQDFINYILSNEGQAVISSEYIAVDDTAAAYSGNMPSGKVVVAGSSSVTPIMEKLKEAYLKINTNAKIEVQMSDSTSGMTGAIDGTCDIGMASRNLKDSEKEKLKNTEIALDGIAIIVNPQNPLTDISSNTIKDVFVGDKLTWNEITE